VHRPRRSLIAKAGGEGRSAGESGRRIGRWS